MKDRSTLLDDIEQRIQKFTDAITREHIVDIITDVLQDYEVTERCKELIVYNDENDRLLKRYTACLYVEGRSLGTVKGYLYRLNDFHKTIGVNFKDVSMYDIRFYLGILKQRGNSSSTIDSVRQYLSAFYSWMNLEGVITSNPCDHVKPIKFNPKVKKPFTDLEVEKN